MLESEFIINRGLTDNNSRKLQISADYIKFEDKDFLNDTFTTLRKEEIIGYRYGMKWISFRVTFGREYLIYIKTTNNKTLKINFKTYFGRKKKEYFQKFKDILDVLWECHFDEIVKSFIERQKKGEEFYIGEVFLSEKNVIIKTGVLNKNNVEIPWEKVRTSNYSTYFSIYSIDNPSKINKGYNYLDDWNTGILYSVIRSILTEKGIEKHK